MKKLTTWKEIYSLKLNEWFLLRSSDKQRWVCKVSEKKKIEGENRLYFKWWFAWDNDSRIPKGTSGAGKTNILITNRGRGIFGHNTYRLTTPREIKRYSEIAVLKSI